MYALSAEARRYGRIRYTAALLEDSPEILQLLYLKIFPVDFKFDYSQDVFEIVALSKHFDLVPRGQVIPDYEVLIEKIPGGYGYDRDTGKWVSEYNFTFKKKP